MNITVSGVQWGDEGKGKIVDWLASRYDVVARFQGGNNAGHTLVVNGKTFKLSLIPSGILHPGKLNVIGGGTVLDPWALLREIQTLEDAEIKVTPDNLVIADTTTLLLPVHKDLDHFRESGVNNSKIGTTLRGIGPAYEDKVGRRSIRVADLRYRSGLQDRLQILLHHHNALRQGLGAEPVDLDQLCQQLLAIESKLSPFVRPVWAILNEANAGGGNILFEGAQGALLDIDHGTYPFVTSSSTLPGAVAAGTGIGPKRIGHSLGICKAYSTRVGEGPFPTELTCQTGRLLAKRGREKGTVTGRDRRCGWLDAVLLKQTCIIAGIDSLAITKVDVLDGLEEINICIGYELDGQPINHFPAAVVEQSRVTPIYLSVPGWKEKTEGINNADDLPVEVKNYITKIEELSGVQIFLLSTSPRREDTIQLVEDWVI